MQNKLSLKRILKWPQFSITVALILLVSIFGTTTPAFLTLGNAVNMARQTAINLIIAIAATYIMTLGCIDLSIGSTQCFACVFAASFIMGGAMNGYGWPIKMHANKTIKRLFFISFPLNNLYALKKYVK